MIEPPVPPNLNKLSPALQAFAEIFLVDQDWIAAGAEASQVKESEAEPLEDWIRKLSDQDCRAYLLRAVQGESHVGNELLQHLRKEFGQAVVTTGTSTGRTLADVIDLAENKQVLRERHEQQVAQQTRQAYLQRLAPQTEMLWRSVLSLLRQQKPKSYGEAVEHLKDLRDLAVMQGEEAEFEQKMADLRAMHRRSSALMKRLKDAQL